MSQRKPLQVAPYPRACDADICGLPFAGPSSRQRMPENPCWARCAASVTVDADELRPFEKPDRPPPAGADLAFQTKASSVVFRDVDRPGLLQDQRRMHRCKEGPGPIKASENFPGCEPGGGPLLLEAGHRRFGEWKSRNTQVQGRHREGRHQRFRPTACRNSCRRLLAGPARRGRGR